MPSINQVTLMGNITRDPDLRYTPSGAAVCTLGLAVNDKFTNKSGETKEETLFVDVNVWTKVAENCVKYLSKGSPVLLTGKLVFQTWEKDGQKQSKISVTAFNVQFLGGRSEKQEQQQAPVEDDDDVPF